MALQTLAAPFNVTLGAQLCPWEKLADFPDTNTDMDNLQKHQQVDAAKSLACDKWFY